MHLNLADTIHLIFDRIFNRNNLDRRVFDFVQRAVECRGFTAAGRTGDQNNPVRQFQQLAENPHHSRRHADGLQVKLHAGFVQQTHHDTFAVHHRNDRHTHIDLAA